MNYNLINITNKTLLKGSSALEFVYLNKHQIRKLTLKTGSRPRF